MIPLSFIFNDNKGIFLLITEKDRKGHKTERISAAGLRFVNLGSLSVILSLSIS